MDANVHLVLEKDGGSDEKDAIMQEFVRQTLNSYAYSNKACINAGFPVHQLVLFKITVILHLFQHYRFTYMLCVAASP